MAQDKFSSTIRIDLIPDIPAESGAGAGKRLVIAPASHKPRALQMRAAGPGGYSRYRELLHGVYDAVLIADLAGRIVDVNVRAVDLFLFPREELCRLTVLELISGADQDLLNNLNQNLDSERHALVQAYCVRRNGTSFAAEIAVSRLKLGELQLAFFVRDVTLRRQAEEMLRTEHNAIQNSGNGIAVANLDGWLEYANPVMARMWGASEAEALVGANVRTLFQDQAAADAMLAATLAKPGGWTGELTGRRQNDDGFDVQVSAARNRNSDGDVVGFVFSFVDVSDRRRAEEALREADRQRVMLESLGAACHHLGQPATVLMANLELIRRCLAEAEPSVRQLVDASVESVRKLGEILQKLQAVNAYQTTQYVEGERPDGAYESRILKI
jgi:two-component system cell cycle sensor histidine kinase/response regulator CckA